MHRALLLEDSKTFRVLAMRILREAGFAVELHAGVVGARAAFAPGRFDLLLVDVGVRENERVDSPGCGLAFVAWARERDPSVRVIVWSGGEEHASRARELGAVFVVKDGEVGERLGELVGAA